MKKLVKRKRGQFVIIAVLTIAAMIISLGTVINRATTYYTHEPWEEYLTLIGNVELNSHRLVELSLTNYTQPISDIYDPTNDTEIFVDNISDVDNNADKGSHSNFTALQHTDTIFDTLTEGTMSGGASSEWLDCNGYDSTYSDWIRIGSSPYLNVQDQPMNYIYESENDDMIGWFSFPNTTFTGVLNVNISIYCNNDDGPSDDDVEVYVDYTGSGAGALAGTVAQHTNWQYDTIELGTHSAADVNNLRVYFKCKRVSTVDEVRIDHIRIGVSEEIANYELDLEVQWTMVDYDEIEEELCIKTGATNWGSEDILVDVWDGSAWQNLLNDLTANSWNNVSISSYLTSGMVTIRFRDGDRVSDLTQDRWDIECALIHVWSVEVEFELNQNILKNNLLQWKTNLTRLYAGHEIALDYLLADGPINLDSKAITYKLGLSHSWGTPTAFSAAHVNFTLDITSIGLYGYKFQSSVFVEVMFLNQSQYKGNKFTFNVIVLDENELPIAGLEKNSFLVSGFNYTSMDTFTQYDETYGMVYTIECEGVTAEPTQLMISVWDHRGIKVIAKYP